MSSKSRVNKTRGLVHVYLFLKDVIKESIVNIQLMDRPTIRDSDYEY